jgi:hypothetical protein
VLKATVRGSGQGPHARLIYGLTSTKKKTASAYGARILTDRRAAREHCKADFTPPRVAKPPSRLIWTSRPPTWGQHQLGRARSNTAMPRLLDRELS